MTNGRNGREYGLDGEKIRCNIVHDVDWIEVELIALFLVRRLQGLISTVGLQ